ncbi:aminotransferase class I/II-fold pyridoxal phosphate-dependent enzyme [Cohnella cholangitidis]|uniref:PLP-dependent aminotransferase family protein n=1 Tax=Cohnella cholangitidis TaxID=2598458 RepID=A0A7G5C2T5_9BACL|nr:PLP-dependent aminotransferase family protein [Cohnella cholangitidis]QMV43519.1 PLP-dependent aminotransferase family protein [Cohnella cholangitidis]
MSSIINWMGGWPKEGLVSSADWEERVEAAAAFAATEQLGILERKSDLYGEEKLREQLAKGLLKGKTGGNGNQIRMTRGADGALAWILENKLIPGDTILTEKLTSRSALIAFRKAGLKVEAVEGDRRGMDPEALTTALFRYRPKMVYVSPTLTDPEGACWSPENKTAVQSRCKEAGVLLVTDDRHEMLIYDQAELRPPRRLEPGALSIGQIPPGLIAGLRIGWIAGATESAYSHSNGTPVREEYSANTIEQLALAQLIEEQPLEPLYDMLRVQCAERMRRMTEQLARKGIEDLSWVQPKGGLHLWVVLPSGLDGESLLRGAWLKGLIFQPGAPFYAKDPRINTLRITHAFADERQMKQGLSRLAESMEEFTGRWSRS